MAQGVRVCNAEVGVGQDPNVGDAKTLFEAFAFGRRVGRHPYHRRTDAFELRSYALQTGELISAVRSPLTAKEQEDSQLCTRK